MEEPTEKLIANLFYLTMFAAWTIGFAWLHSRTHLYVFKAFTFIAGMSSLLLVIVAMFNLLETIRENGDK